MKREACIKQSIIFFLSILLLVPAAAFAQGNPSHSPCFWTSKSALQSCSHEIEEEYYIAQGNCYNLSDSEERTECLVDARVELREAKKECREVYDARQEVCDLLGEGPYDPDLDPADFVDPALIGASDSPNPYLSLVPGNQNMYEGETEDGTEKIIVTVTGRIKEIEYPEESGNIFKCAVVRDVVYVDDEVVEDTEDWFAQDNDGNVWYFGEIAKNYEDGELADLEGSWTAGIDNAKPGIVMYAEPAPGAVYRQEWLLGDAEDMAQVLGIVPSVRVGDTTFMDVLKTSEWTPLEPDSFENKYFAPGVGLIVEENLESGERVEILEAENEPFEEAELYVVYSESDENARITGSTEAADAFQSVQIYGPEGSVVHTLSFRDEGGTGQADFEFETPDPELEELEESYPEGTYYFWGLTTEGDVLQSSVTLSYDLLDAAEISYPADGDENVSPDNLVITFSLPEGTESAVIEIEDEESDASLEADLSADASGFAVPDGWLESGAEYTIDIKVKGDNGNMTGTDLSFTTQ